MTLSCRRHKSVLSGRPAGVSPVASPLAAQELAWAPPYQRRHLPIYNRVAGAQRDGAATDSGRVAETRCQCSRHAGRVLHPRTIRLVRVRELFESSQPKAAKLVKQCCIRRCSSRGESRSSSGALVMVCDAYTAHPPYRRITRASSAASALSKAQRLRESAECGP